MIMKNKIKKGFKGGNDDKGMKVNNEYQNYSQVRNKGKKNKKRYNNNNYSKQNLNEDYGNNKK